jgi:hypothetical protein
MFFSRGTGVSEGEKPDRHDIAPYLSGIEQSGFFNLSQIRLVPVKLSDNSLVNITI